MPHNPSVKNQKIFDSSLYTREPWALPRQCNNLNLTKGCDCVKKKTIILTIVLVTLVVVFFPTSTTHSISGNGEVLTRGFKHLFFIRYIRKITKFIDVIASELYFFSFYLSAIHFQLYIASAVAFCMSFCVCR